MSQHLRRLKKLEINLEDVGDNNLAGYIISVIGGKGGVGKSVFAANLAFAYAMDRRQKVLLLDFDQRALGDLSLITGIKHRKTLKDLSEFSGSIEPRSLQQFISPPLQNVSFLGMPREQTVANSIEAESLGK